MSNDFYLRYYVGHKGKFGHEFLEFEFRPDGKLRWGVMGWVVLCSSTLSRYANNSNYKNDTMIRKEAYSHQAVMDELRRIIEDSEVILVTKTWSSSWSSLTRPGRAHLALTWPPRSWRRTTRCGRSQTAWAARSSRSSSGTSTSASPPARSAGKTNDMEQIIF